MFTHMVPIKTVYYKVRNTEYELLVYQVSETGQYNIYVVKGGFGVGDIFTASQEVIQDGKMSENVDIVESLIRIAISDINRNEFGYY